MTESRVHHYGFVHRVLAGAAAEFGPKMVVTPPVREVGQSLLAMWEGFGQSLTPEQQLPGDGLAGCLLEREGHRLLLVTLPEPIAPTEAYFAAVVLPPGADSCRYLTLEYSVGPADGAPGTVLGEWADQNHVNLGQGPEPTPEAFVTAVLAAVRTAEPRGWRGLFHR
ncbi:hypothetical protein [Kitasatospora sp. NBC_00315]|uniref:hypothetical protein n=1 Tax=Kitasatospora sp. NBC_00315 TaxID=2975963 RepID=UPI003249808F